MHYQSIVILGRQPALGLAELESLYGPDNVAPAGPQAAGLTLHAHDVDFDRLGGATRLAHVLAELPTTDWRRIEKQLPELILELGLTLPDGKIQLGLSAFDLQVTPARLNAAGLTLKKILRSRLDRSVRVTPNPEPELSTAAVLHNHLTGATGIELLLVAIPGSHSGQGRTIVARTTRVQDIDSYTIRDRGRPKRDARVGMLPPKLAQIIINLAKPSPGATVLDPFCGTGVLLQEALLMGNSVYGTDLDPRMVDYTTQNLDWLKSQQEWIRKNVDEHHSRSILLEQQDATTFQAHNPAGVETVACETYLGRPFTSQPTPEVLAQTATEVNLILRKTLQNLYPQLVPGMRHCFAVPAWQISPGKFKHLPLIDHLDELGYNRERFEHVRNSDLLYYREDQIVARELLVLTRK